MNNYISTQYIIDLQMKSKGIIVKTVLHKDTHFRILEL
jgi:hypothetical protein